MSLGIICSGSAFASGDEDGSKPHKPPKSCEISKSHKLVKNSKESEKTVKSCKTRKTDKDLKSKFIRVNRGTFNYALECLESMKLYKGFPKTIEELADIVFDEEYVEDFLIYLYNKNERIEEKDIISHMALWDIMVMAESARC